MAKGFTRGAHCSNPEYEDGWMNEPWKLSSISPLPLPVANLEHVTPAAA
jgi:hypothetical protein